MSVEGGSRYRLWGLLFQSARPLPMLAPVAADEAPYARIAFAPPDAAAVQTLAPGRTFAQGVATTPAPGGTRLVFEGCCAFDVADAPGHLTVVPAPDLPETTLVHLLLDHAVPRALASWGHVVLHASAVELPEGTVAFFGVTGRGKSTLAAAFAATGLPVVADDGVRIEAAGGTLLAHPSHPGLRLWADSADLLLPGVPGEIIAQHAPKRRVVEGLLHTRRARPLLRAYALGDRLPADADPPVGIEPLRRSEAFLALTESCMSLDDRPAALRRDFDRLAESPLLDCVRRLRYAEGAPTLGIVAERICAEARRRR